ncbi:uncharacterized protein LOC34618033 [Cyclospora cayetanensis]|uniref:ATP-dependent RNA helicase n=1 Tax=Cyclospora cayetanensis TaxID=88456 RepID=A0A6P6RRQ4_9EIME|nr:uncharacterized protein LOC34618033 [Cyclospora cayetanensis]
MYPRFYFAFRPPGAPSTGRSFRCRDFLPFGAGALQGAPGGQFCGQNSATTATKRHRPVIQLRRLSKRPAFHGKCLPPASVAPAEYCPSSFPPCSSGSTRGYLIEPGSAPTSEQSEKPPARCMDESERATSQPGGPGPPCRSETPGAPCRRAGFVAGKEAPHSHASPAGAGIATPAAPSTDTGLDVEAGAPSVSSAGAAWYKAESSLPKSGALCIPLPQEPLLGLLRVAGVTHLLPLQQLALPLLLQRQVDVLLAAPTGTGKSLAAAVAVVSSLVSEQRSHLSADKAASGSSSTAGRGPRGPSLGCVLALVVTPTRDMAVQTRKLLGAIGRYSQLRVSLLLGRGPGESGSGGCPWEQFVVVHRQRPHVLVCTPGKAEELTHFLLAASQRRMEEAGQIPKGTTSLLSNCKLMVVEDAALQLQEPLMLRTLAKLKELMPADHKCIMLASSLSWEVRGTAARLMRVNSFILNCLEGPPPMTASALLQWRAPQQLSHSLPLVTPGNIETSQSKCLQVLLPTLPLPKPEETQVHTDAPQRAARLRPKKPLAEPPPQACMLQDENTPPMGVTGPLESLSNNSLETEVSRVACILDLEQPQSLWGPKRSQEFLSKKRYELSRAPEGARSTVHFPSSGFRNVGMPEEFLLYPPELHGHLLFNVLQREATAAAAADRAALSETVANRILPAGEAGGAGPRLSRPCGRVLVFFSSTKALQFHYALFKHFLLPNAENVIYQAKRAEAESRGSTEALNAKEDDNTSCSRSSSAFNSSDDGFLSNRGRDGSNSKWREGEDMNSSVAADCWPVDVPLPSLLCLHSRLSAEKRRAVVEAFAAEPANEIGEGVQKARRLKVLFCTDVAAVGVQLGCPQLIMQVGTPKSVELYVQRAARAPRGCRKLLALSDLDGHFLFECYKQQIHLQEADAQTTLCLLKPSAVFAAALGERAGAVSYRAAAKRYQDDSQRTLGVHRPQTPEDSVEQDKEEETGLCGLLPEYYPAQFCQKHVANDENGVPQPSLLPLSLASAGIESAEASRSPVCSIPTTWEAAVPLRASCELMYRSLLGLYALQASRLKYER